MTRDRAAIPEAKPARLFVAVEIPDGARRVVERAVAPIRSAFPRARWAPAGSWHVTMRFLGSTPPRLVPWVAETVSGVAAAHATAPTRLTSLGSFPSPGRTRVLWVGLEDARGRLAAIAGSLDEALAAEVPREERAFTAHLTVARSDPPLRLDPALLATPIEATPFTVERLVLFRSHLRSPAPRYEPLGTFPLSGSS
ncbi:MAG: RNA 2',3'-cyclic phosphodiesterase [Actinomycetota bacterium]